MENRSASPAMAPRPPYPGAAMPGELPVHAQPEGRKSKVNTVVNAPYFTPGQLDRLLSKARANKWPPAKWEQSKMAACSFIAAIGAKLGIPQSTIASAQLLYQRFHLFYPPSDFVVHQVALASLFTAAKLNDTQKRMNDFLLASYALRYPELLTPPAGVADITDWVAHAYVAEQDIDTEALAQERVRLLTLERMMLQCICFQFEMRAAKVLRLSIKVSREWAVPKALSTLAWRVACDAHRTPAPLIYPPQTVAIGSVYAAALLTENDGACAAALARFAHPNAWPATWGTSADDAQEVALQILSAYAAHLPGLDAGSGALPAYLAHPPPLGLLTWRARRVACGESGAPSELDALLTQAKIRLQHHAQARDEPEHVRRGRAVARAVDTLPATLYRPTMLEQHMVATRYLLE